MPSLIVIEDAVALTGITFLPPLHVLDSALVVSL